MDSKLRGIIQFVAECLVIGVALFLIIAIYNIATRNPDVSVMACIGNTFKGVWFNENLPGALHILLTPGTITFAVISVGAIAMATE